MGIIDMVTALLQLLIQYYKLKNQSLFFDVINSFDNTLDKLEAERSSLRKVADSKSQQKADDVMDEIIETQKKKKLFLDDWKAHLPK
jgi:hypothetical protein